MYSRTVIEAKTSLVLRRRYSEKAYTRTIQMEARRSVINYTIAIIREARARQIFGPSWFGVWSVVRRSRLLS